VVNFSNSVPPEGVEAKAVHSENTFQSIPLVVENNRKLVRVELQGTQQRGFQRSPRVPDDL